MTTIETIQVTYGAVMDGAALVAIALIPVMNRRIRKQEQMECIWRKIEHQLDFEPMYWWEKEESEL